MTKRAFLLRWLVPHQTDTEQRPSDNGSPGSPPQEVAKQRYLSWSVDELREFGIIAAETNCSLLEYKVRQSAIVRLDWSLSVLISMVGCDATSNPLCTKVGCSDALASVTSRASWVGDAGG